MTDLLILPTPDSPLGRKPQITGEDLPTLVATAFNDGASCHTLGLAHFYGVAGLKQNAKAALEWFNRGIQSGNVHSAVCAGWIMLEQELTKNEPNEDVLTSSIAYLEQGKDENITEIGYPNPVKLESLIETARQRISNLKRRPTAKIIDISYRSRIKA